MRGRQGDTVSLFGAGDCGCWGSDFGNMSRLLRAVKFEFFGEGAMVDGAVADKFFYKNIANFGNMY